MRAVVNEQMAAIIETLRRTQAALWADLDAASKAWNAIPGTGTGQMGLTPDAIKFGPEYQAASKRYAAAHKALQNFNKTNRKLLPLLREPRKAREAVA